MLIVGILFCVGNCEIFSLNQIYLMYTKVCNYRLMWLQSVEGYKLCWVSIKHIGIALRQPFYVIVIEGPPRNL